MVSIFGFLWSEKSSLLQRGKTSTMFKLLFLLQLKQLTFIELWYERSILNVWYNEIHFYFIVGKFVPSVISTGVFGNSCVIIIVNHTYLVKYHINRALLEYVIFWHNQYIPTNKFGKYLKTDYLTRCNNFVHSQLEKPYPISQTIILIKCTMNMLPPKEQ